MADISVSATFPFERLAIAIIEARTKEREQMDPDIRRRWDIIGIETAEYAWGEAKKLIAAVKK
jgi:hypothetical protein